MTDRDIWRLNRGGHDPHKVYAAYHEAMQSAGKPTVIFGKKLLKDMVWANQERA
ncbi:MAG: hypothetical protein Ct9H300mP5_1970 [Candidatus Pelagibacterales bacterium]|nr:MAG: hypothetical protein Ct9H300mP5_1970 [Pelagibacterales bacterium]